MITTPVPPKSPPAVTDDFSRHIEAAVEKRPDEEVRCVRVFEDRYRCNWWVRDLNVSWGGVTSGRIVKSKFLRATQTPDGVLLEEMGK